MTFDQELAALADSVGTAASKAVELWRAGTLSLDDLVTLLEQYLQLCNVNGNMAGQLAYMMRNYGKAASVTMTPAAGSLDSAIAADAVASAVKSAATGEPSLVEMKLVRLVQGATVKAGQGGWSDQLRKDPNVEGWTRGLESDACQLCRWWWREGQVWPKDHVMPTHPGCTCYQQIVKK